MNTNTLNEFAIPLHACNGYRHDEHWWTWAQWVIHNCKQFGYDGLKVYYKVNTFDGADTGSTGLRVAK